MMKTIKDIDIIELWGGEEEYKNIRKEYSERGLTEDQFNLMTEWLMICFINHDQETANRRIEEFKKGIPSEIEWIEQVHTTWVKYREDEVISE